MDFSKNLARRWLFSCSWVVGSTTTLFPSQSCAADAATVDYKAVAADIRDLVKANPDWGPTFVRLAWHSSGMYH